MNNYASIKPAVAYEEAGHMVVGDAFGLRIKTFEIGPDSGEVTATVRTDDPDAEGAFYLAGQVAAMLAGLSADDLAGSKLDETRARWLAREIGCDEVQAFRRWRHLAVRALIDRWVTVERIAGDLRAGKLEINL